MTNQVKWTDTIRRLMGLENNEIAEVVREVLTKLTRQIKRCRPITYAERRV